MKIYLYGEPGCGKTHICMILIYLLESDGWRRSKFDYGLVRGLKFTKIDFRPIWILGVFDDTLFQGTDRLSMSVQPQAVQFVKKMLGEDSLFIEGDRLFRPSFFDAVEFDEIGIVDAHSAVLMERREARGSNQPISFLKAKRTAIANMAPRVKIRYTNEKESDAKDIANILANKLIVAL